MSTSNLNLSNSHKLMKDGHSLIAGFTQSMMKKPEQFCPGRYPVYLQTGNGALVTDVDGNEYIDYICGLGANTLGHNHPAVTQTIIDHLPNGVLHSLPTSIEIDAARSLVELIPGAEMVRFFKTGADANSAAIRLARYITGRENIITVGYNGWHDHFMYDTPGIPGEVQKLTTRLPLFAPTDEPAVFEMLEQQKDSTAALILSVPYTRELSADFMQRIQQICRAKGIIFVLDEVVTGFRLAPGGAQEYFGVQADLVTLSKGIAAGMPLSAITGSRSVMEQLNALQVSTTFGGELLSLATCVAALNVYRSSDYFSHIAKLGRQLKEGVNALAKTFAAPLCVIGYDAIPMFVFDRNPDKHLPLAKEFVGLMAEQGILLRRDVNFISAAHTSAQIEQTLAAISNALSTMSQLGLFLENNVNEPVVEAV